MKAVILCAGLGTRLRPLTERWPKCGIPLLGQPLFRYNLALLKGAGVTEVGINVHHLPAQMERIAQAECERAGIALTTSREAVLLGTGGGLRGFKRWLGGKPFIVLNGDVLFAVQLRPLFERHVQDGRLATMVLTPMPPNEKFASVEVDGGGRVWRIGGRGRPGTAPEPLRACNFASVQLLSPAIFDFMSPDGPEEIFTDVYARLWASGLEVQARVVEGAYWADLGTPRRYLDAAFDLLTGKVPLSLFPGGSPFERGRELAPSVWAAPDAGCEGEIRGPSYLGVGSRVALGASLERVVLEEGAQVAAGERLTELVAWEGVRLSLEPRRA